jgi:hypothetical protein
MMKSPESQATIVEIKLRLQIASRKSNARQGDAYLL